MPDRPAPLVPPVATADLPGTGGSIGPEPEDFRVDEVPLYAASGEGEHLYVRLQKRAFTTRDAVRAVADAAGVPVNEIGTAGMKDKHAVTTQWVSLPARRAKAPESWILPEGLAVLAASRHANKLRTGHLSGNLFQIRIVGVAADAIARASAILEHLRERGLPNYFGAQRFGFGGNNVADAFGWLEGEASRTRRRRVPPFEQKLFVSVLQAEVFNRYVTARIAEGLEKPLAGEVVRLEGTGSMFVVEDVERESARWATRDVHPTGPMIGPKMKAALGRPLELEQAAAESLGIVDALRAELARSADGTRRDLLLRLGDVRVVPGGEDSLTVEFFLPSGSYATLVVRELTREPFLRTKQAGGPGGDRG